VGRGYIAYRLGGWKAVDLIADSEAKRTNPASKKLVQISMDGRGRCHDNIFVERLWWTVKHEWVYLRPAANGIEQKRSLAEFFEGTASLRSALSRFSRKPRRTEWLLLGSRSILPFAPAKRSTKLVGEQVA
jgi:transposase InsO family protein